jgi:hypothetical protein
MAEGMLDKEMAMSGVVSRSPVSGYRLTWTAQADQRLAKMREQGASLRCMARAFGLSRSVVTARARAIGLEIPTKPELLPRPAYELSDNRDPLPAGHPISWGLITQGTSLEGNPYTPPQPVRGRSVRKEN